jgi:hypothetical protein
MTLGAHAGGYKYRVLSKKFGRSSADIRNGICSKADNFGALAGSGDLEALIRVEGLSRMGRGYSRG